MIVQVATDNPPSPIATLNLLLIIIIAIAGRDYDPLSAQRLDFSMVGDSQCVAISINDDSEPEGNEIFIAQVVITIVGSERKIVSLPFLITIVDNDGTLHLKRCNYGFQTHTYAVIIILRKSRLVL